MKTATKPARPSMRRAAFDPSCDFVALEDLRISGVVVAAGEGVDKSGVSPRRLEQLYEARKIGYGRGQSPTKPLPRPRAVGPTDLYNPGACGQKAAPPKKVGRVRSRRAA